MKKFLLLIAVIILSALSTICALAYIYFKDEVEFLSPVGLMSIRIRNDGYGDGRFGADRKNDRSHQGVDILAPVGMPIVAAKSGIAKSGFDKYGYGNYVEIYHRGGLITLYGHLVDTNIKRMKIVRQGEVIGWVGKGGNAGHKGLKPHLHFEVRENGVLIDPLTKIYGTPKNPK